MTKILLGKNKIGDAGAKALAETLKTNTSVTEIYLAWNKIGDAGMQALAEALKTNTSVTWIDLGSETTNFQTLVGDYLKRNRTNAQKLIDAVRNTDTPKVKKLLALSVSVNYQDRNRKTALHYAIQEGHIEILHLLLASSTQILSKITSSPMVQLKDKNGNTLLHQAVRLAVQDAGLARVLAERLLALGVKLYVKNHAGQYPFQLCIPATAQEKP